MFNREGIEGQAEVILCEALLDALTFWAAGYRNVTSCYGVTGVPVKFVPATSPGFIPIVLTLSSA